MMNLFTVGERVSDADGRIAMVISQMHWKPKADLVRVRLDNSTRYELIPSNQLIALPSSEQYPALGGTYGE